MDKTSLKHRTFTNAGFSFFSYIWPILFSFLITPIIVLKLGVEQYGLLIFITAVSGIIGIVASGAEAASIKHLSHYHSRGENDNIRNLFGTINSVYLAIGVVGATVIIGGFIFGSKVVPKALSFSHDQLFFLFTIVALQFLIQTSFRLYQTIPSALQRFDIASALSMINLTVTSICNLALVLANFGIEALLIFQLVWSTLMLVVWISVSRRLLPSLSSYTFKLDQKVLKSCFRFGSLASINEFARTSLFSLDRILIPLWGGGISSLTYYTVPGNLSARIPGISDNLSGIMFPTASSLNSVGHTESLQNLYIRSSRLISLLSISITVAIIFNAEKIMLYWLDESFARNSTGILIILALTNLVLSLLSPVASFFMGMNKLRFNTLLSFAMAGINIAALALLLPRFGITGAAWAYFLSVLPIFYAIYVIENRYLNLKGRGVYYMKFVSKHAIISAFTALIIYWVLNPLIGSLFALAIIGPLCVALYISLFIFMGFLEKEDARDIKSFIGSKFKRQTAQPDGE